MPIIQTIGAIRTLTDAPNPLTDTQEVFDEKGYAYTLSQKNVNDDMKARVTELNTAFEQVNTLADELNTAKDIAVESGNTATTKAGEASTSATNALNAQLAAESILDNFDDRYLGAKSTPPTVDNDGNPLQSGAMYWNSTNSVMYVRDAVLNQWISLSFTPTSHSALSNLSADDHTQYHNDTRGDARYLKLSGGAMDGAITGLKETSVAIGANDIDLSLGNLFTKTITGATTLTVSNVPTSGTAQSLILELTNGGSNTITWFSGVKWTGGTAPTLTASGVDVLGFYTVDGGTTWRGLTLSKDSK